MKRKLIALDLDGTTLNGKTQITQKTKEVLNKAQQAGHVVSIVTGRPNRMAVGYYDELKLKGPMINFNGALGYVPHKQWEHEYQTTFSKNIAFDILEAKQRLGIKVVSAEGKTMALSDVPNTLIDGFFPAALRKDQVLNRTNLKHDPAAMTMLVDQNSKADIVKKLEKRSAAKSTSASGADRTRFSSCRQRASARLTALSFWSKPTRSTAKTSSPSETSTTMPK